MSDDTPTRRFGSPGDEPPEQPAAQPPTERFDVQADADEEPDGLTQLFGGTDDPTGPTTAMPAAPAAPVPPAGAAPAQPADPLAWLHTGPAAPAAASAPQTEVLGAAAAPAARPAADATTMRFDQLPPLPPTEGGSGDEPPSSGPGRGVIIGLAIAGGALLIAIVVLLVVILGGGGDDADEAGDTGPSTSDTPRPTTTSRTPTPTPSESTPTPEPTTATPTPTPTVTTPPTPTAPRISNFAATSVNAACPDEVSIVEVSLSWTIVDATQVSVTVDGSAVPNSGTSPFAAPFNCAATTHSYGLQASGPGGTATSTSITVTRQVTAPPEEGDPEE